MRNVNLLKARLILSILCVLSIQGFSQQSANLLQAPNKIKFNIKGIVGDRLNANMTNWELVIPKADPAMLQMFFDRDKIPARNLLPWSGEFVGKYLCASILSYKLLRKPEQLKNINLIIDNLMLAQGPEGYLGPFDQAHRLKGQPTNWDIWGHYWVMRSMLTYYQEFGNEKVLKAVEKTANMMIDSFFNKDFHFVNDGSYGEMNYAIIHAFTELGRITGQKKYVDMARWIEKEWELPICGQYISSALQGKEMFQFKAHRWESLHDFMGICGLYFLTGDKKYYDAFTNIWKSIQRGDRHNTGGFSTNEATTGNPYQQGSIETCSTVAWIDLSIKMLQLTGNSIVADEIEMSTFNGLIGGQNPGGRWWTYNTPMNGIKEASAHTINFQCRPGSPDLNCCSVNGPRGLTLIADWAVMKSKEEIYINYYGPSSFSLTTPDSKPLEITEQTNYPLNGNILMKVGLENEEKFDLKLRIPAWSNHTIVKINGKVAKEVRPGTYLSVNRVWRNNDVIEIVLDMASHFWIGEKEEGTKTSVYYGPLLLAFDPAFNSISPDEIPDLDIETLSVDRSLDYGVIKPWKLFTIRSADGRIIRLCDFASAGMYGNAYRSWLPVKTDKGFTVSGTGIIWATKLNVAGKQNSVSTY